MNKFGIFIITFFANAPLCLAADEVASELGQNLKTHSHEPGIFSIVFSLLFVICLIYATGLIYSKLNIMGAKSVKEQLKNLDLGTAMVLSTTQLGQGKNLHVIEIDNKRLLIGVTPNSINLIKELDKIDEIKETNPKPEETFDVHKKYL